MSVHQFLVSRNINIRSRNNRKDRVITEHLDENLDVNLYEEHGQCHRKICISLESNMAVTHLQVVKRQNSLRQNKILDVQYIGWGISVNLTKKFVTVIKNPKPGGDHCFHCLRTSLKLPS